MVNKPNIPLLSEGSVVDMQLVHANKSEGKGTLNSGFFVSSSRGDSKYVKLDEDQDLVKGNAKEANDDISLAKKCCK